MKHVIANRDINDPAEFKEIAPLGGDLELADFEDASPALSPVIAEAPASANQAAVPTQSVPRPPSDKGSVQTAQQEIEEDLKARAKKLAADKLGERMSATVSVRVFQKRPANFGNFEQQVVQLFLLGDKYLNMSNADLAAHMDAKYEGFTVKETLFYAPLKPWAKKKVQLLLGQYERRIDLRGRPTLSSIKTALKGNAASKKAKSTFQAKFVFTDNEVVVNGRVYPITVTKKVWRRIRVGEQWLSVNNLEALLRNGSPPILSE